MCAVTVLLLINPKFALTSLIVVGVAALIANGGRRGNLAIDDDKLVMSNPFTSVVMFKKDLIRTKIRGNRFLGFELILDGKCQAQMKNGKTSARSSILIANIFSVDILEVKKSIDSWKKNPDPEIAPSSIK
jgi:hypothetical protein